VTGRRGEDPSTDRDIRSNHQEYDVTDENSTGNADAARTDEAGATDPVTAPTVPAAPVEAGEAGDPADAGDAGDAGDRVDSEQDRLDLLEQEGDIAADYLEELLDIADLDGDLDMDVEGDRAAVSIVGAQLEQLVGRDGEVLEALQELTRLAVYRETGERSRLMLDIGGFRADKRTKLERLAAETAAKVKESGEPVSLSPMTPFERKVVHDAVAEAGLTSESEGEEPRRYVVVLPAGPA
jgi:spoIIIJ-associated protein